MIDGYAAVFYDGTERTEFRLGPNMVERIHPGAFDEAFRDDDVVGLFNHDESLLLGRRSAGTLRLIVDAQGARYEIDEGETTIGRDVAEMQKRGDLKGSSFTFGVRNSGQEIRREGGTLIRDIRQFAYVSDVGPVTFPAYSGTEARSSGRGERRYVSTDGQAVAVPEAFGTEARSLFAAYSNQRDSRSRRVKTRVRLLQLERTGVQ